MAVVEAIRHPITPISFASEPTIIIWARHGHAYNPDGLLSGHAKFPLSKTGIQQAHELALKLRDLPIAAVGSSDLRRGLQTRNIVAKDIRELTEIDFNKLVILRRDGLRERYYGYTLENEKNKISEREYLKSEEFKQMHLRDMINNLDPKKIPSLELLPGMESDVKVLARIKKVFKNIAELFPGKTVLLIGHGNTMRTFLVDKEYGTRRELRSSTIGNTAYITLEIDGDKIKIQGTSGFEKAVSKGDEDQGLDVLRFHFHHVD